MDDLEILQQQIADQIEGVTRHEVVMGKTVDGRLESTVKFSLIEQNGGFWAKAEIGTPVKILEDTYHQLKRMEAYLGNSWEFQSQYLGQCGFDWVKLYRK